MLSLTRTRTTYSCVCVYACLNEAEAADRRNPRRKARPAPGSLLASTEWVIYTE
jgi:hypothetical protein